MCLVVIAHRVHPELPLIVAGNRDEFHLRPASDADWWHDNPDILGGRDLEAGGTWLGIHRSGRFATVTNYRDADQPSARYRSRGGLITDFLETDSDPLEHVTSIDGDSYAGFNLLAAASGRLVYASNRGAGTRELKPGIYAVANATLDTPWPKVERCRATLTALIRGDDVGEQSLFDMLADRTRAPMTDIVDADTGMAPERARALSAPFVVMPDYGTRCSSVVLIEQSGRCRLAERRFSADGEETGRSEHVFDVVNTR